MKSKPLLMLASRGAVVEADVPRPALGATGICLSERGLAAPAATGFKPDTSAAFPHP